VVADAVEREDLVTAGLLVHSASLTGTLAYRGVGRGTERQLTWYDRMGKPLATLGDPDRSIRRMPRLSPDGRYVAISRNLDGNGDLWLIETMRGVIRRITFDPVYEGWPVWSPDGDRLLFNSYLNGKTDLYVMSTTAGGAATLLLDTPAGKNPSDWSANGYVLYSDLRGTLWALPTEKNAEPFTISRLGTGGQFSPDGRWVAYSSTESGTSEIYLQPFPGPGTKTRISTTGGRWPTWRGDGREVFYIASDNRVMAVPLTGSGPSIEAGPPVPLFAVNVEPPPLTSSQPPYDVSPDGQRILVDTIVGEGETAPITVVLNWGGGKRK
jgi:dipeptidyl aminopeptidase/acylaminoacyl peptidase